MAELPDMKVNVEVETIDKSPNMAEIKFKFAVTESMSVDAIIVFQKIIELFDKEEKYTKRACNWREVQAWFDAYVKHRTRFQD